MGACNGCKEAPDSHDLSTNPFEFTYGEDKAYLERPHMDTIHCRAREI